MPDPAERQTDFGEKSRAAGSFFAMLCLFGLAALFFFAGDSLFRWLAAIPALLGLLLFYSGVHALLALRTPPTTLKLDEVPLRAGHSVGLVIRQAGPALFDSLRANLVCERIVRGAGKSRTVTYPVQANFFETGPCEVAKGDCREFRATLQVPSDAEPSLNSARLIVAWRVEVWGRVRDGADLQRPFGVEVVK